MGRRELGPRAARRWTVVRRGAKAGLGVLGVFLVGLLAAGALAEAGPLDLLTSTASTSGPTDTTPTESTPTEPSGTTETQPAPPPSAPTAPYIVTFAAGVSDTDARAAVGDAGGTVDSSLAVLRMYFVSLTADAASALASDGRVTRVDADRPREAAGTPDDTRYGDQWALPRIGWDLVYGELQPAGQAEVAILDTGVDASHPELDGVVVPGTSILPGGAWSADPNGHGTAMAGIVAAETNNGAGIAGVGYDGVRVMPVTVLGADGTGQDSDIIEGVVWATQHGADVILMAFSNPGYSASLQAAIDYAWSQGVVLVAAAGNDSTGAPQFPAGDRGVMGVSNTDLADSLAGSSNYGQAAFIAAPGQGIATVDGTVSGTSASAAVVAGAAALVKASSGGVSNGVIVSRLARNADAAGTTAQTGNGRINLARALADTSSDSLHPAGAAPVGGGGPIVGPYVVAGNGDINGVIRDSVTNALLSGATVSVTCSGCNGAATVTYGGGGSSTNATGAYAVAFNYPGNGPATITVTAAKAGYTSNAGSSATITCTNNGACNGSPFTRNLTLTPAVRATATTVTCSPATVALNQGSTCNAVVDDTAAGTKSNPSGTVTFSRSGVGSGAFSPATTCTLAPVPSDPDSSQCSVTYTPSAGVNVHTIDAAYGGSGAHSASGDPDGFALTVTLRSTSTEVLCSPSSVAFGQGSTCTATVSDTDAGTKSFPTGSVTFDAAPAAAGAFSSPGTTCTLGQVGATTTSSCSVTYTPSADEGTHTITGSYGAGSTHAASSDTFDLTVTKRTTATTVTCAPANVAIDQGTVCTAVVDDVDGASKSSPSGSVDFSRSGAGTGNFSSASCTLAATDADSSSCQVGYRPTSGAGTHTVEGAYQGSTTHTTSDDDFGVTVTLRDTTTTVACVPGTAAIDEDTTCTATVADADAGSKSHPTGTVTFGSDSSGAFSGPGTTCTLGQVGATTTSSCSVTYTPSGAAGTHTITGSYGAGSTHAASSDTFDLTVTKRTTATTVTCAPASVAIDQGTVCTATVDDTDSGSASSPSGSVDFSRSGAGTGNFSSASCTLAAADADSSSCQVGYRPTSGAGTHTVDAAYQGSATHAPSDDDFDLTVTLRETATTVTCAPASVAINQGTVCTAVVDDIDGGSKSSPAGAVSFGSDETGSFSSAACTLAATDADSSSCQVGYRPTANAGTHTITGSYGGSATHAAGSDQFALTVTLRDTATTVTCVPATVAIDQGTVCTATVNDIDGGSKSSPSGSVDFTPSGAGGGNFSSASCTLSPAGADSSSCQVGYRPTAGDGTHTVTGAYQGSSTHATSSDGFDLTVTKRSTSTSVTCVPASVVVNQATTCTATVADTEAGTKSAPGGTVSFSSSGAGAFSAPGSSCTLAPAGADSSSCSVTYTPSSAAAATHTITGSYGGSAKHAMSSGTFGVSVAKRATATTIACVPSVQQIGQNMTCTATVKDVDANGTKTPPQGTVTFAKAVGDSGNFPSGPTCTLNAAVVTGDTNTCTVTYTSPVATVDALSAQYNGSTVHATSATNPLSPLLVVFYDPNGGFVTGGGWIDSPAGAYRPDTSLTGKANFGFVSKYKRGQTTPTGQTEFQFHTGSLNFHSEAYEWLVVSANNTKAQYKGTGTINGASGYGFMITAYDGNPDRFRIKIWKLSDSSIVYDNNFGSSDDIDTVPMQIAQGSIVIHK